MKQSPVGINVVILEIISPVDCGGIKWNPLVAYINREAILVGEVRVEFSDHWGDSLWWVHTKLNPPLSPNPVGEIGIEVVETLLMYQGAVVEGVVIETLHCKIGESTWIFQWKGRLAGA